MQDILTKTEGKTRFYGKIAGIIVRNDTKEYHFKLFSLTSGIAGELCEQAIAAAIWDLWELLIVKPGDVETYGPSWLKFENPSRFRKGLLVLGPIFSLPAGMVQQ